MHVWLDVVFPNRNLALGAIDIFGAMDIVASKPAHVVVEIHKDDDIEPPLIHCWITSLSGQSVIVDCGRQIIASAFAGLEPKAILILSLCGAVATPSTVTRHKP